MGNDLLNPTIGLPLTLEPPPRVDTVRSYSTAYISHITIDAPSFHLVSKIIALTMGSLNVTAVRHCFPALAQPQVFFDNAGGSQTLGAVIDS